MGSPTLPGGPEDPDRTHEPVPYRAPVWLYTPSPPQNAWQRWGRSATLFVVTLASVFLAGAIQLVEIPGYGAILGFSAGEGLALMVGLISVLLAHEMGHYLACRHYHVDATLPNFIPSPWIPALGLAVWQPLSFVGTFGAFIRIRSPIPHRRALFDIGIAGPLAGFVVCLPVLVLGVLDGHVVPHTPGGLEFGEPLLFQWVSHAINGPIPPGEILAIGALGQAAWFGLFVTALNLMPIGQLDGGHATYSLLREGAHRISRIGSWICVALVYFGPNWILWAILLRVLGRRHPPTLNDDLPVGRGRKLVGLLSLVVFVVCFVPNPVIWSWTDFFEAVGLNHVLNIR